MKRWFEASSSQSPEAPESRRLKLDTSQVHELNASLYELYSPPGTPSMEVLFFHGFQHGDYDEAHLSGWTCGDGSGIIWPQTWLVKRFCDARILTVSYNASVMKSQGSFDVFNMSENLITDLLDAKVGQMPSCPVILVGHSFGGLVIKQQCVEASSETGRSESNSRSSKLKSFLQNVKGIFFYSTPHYGIADNIAEHFVDNRPLLEYVKTLSLLTARLNYHFEKLYGQGGKYQVWQIAAVGESLSTKCGRFDDRIVVREASSRYGSDFNLVEGADHISVCRPINEKSRSFRVLKTFLDRFPTDSKVVVPIHQCHGLPRYPTGLKRRANRIQEMLKTAQVIGIVGMGGIGKTTLAKEVFNNISTDFEYTCFADNVKGIPEHELDDWLLRHLHRKGTKVDGNKIQWSDLMQTKSLIFMDDVNCERQIRNLPSVNHFGSSSRLIFTTRIQSVLDTVPDVAMCEVDFLDFDEAKELFCLHAFEQERIPDNLLEVNHHLEANVQKVVQKCDGLPLTLEVMGSYLRSHKTNARVWEETYDKLQKAQSPHGLRNERVWSSLRVSYDALASEEQAMFIEAGTFFFGQPVERALAAWSSAFGYSESRWANLLRTSMVKQVDKTEWDRKWGTNIKYKEVWVHEQLRDLAKHLSKGAIISMSVEESYGDLDAMLSQFKCILNSNAVKAQTSTLQLDAIGPFQLDAIGSFQLNHSKLRLESLNELDKLNYVELVCFPCGASSGNLSTNLSLLRWKSSRYRVDNSYPMRANGRYSLSLPTIGVCSTLLPVSLEGMNNLAVLELDYWDILEESLRALGKLSNLRILSLSDIRGPSRLPENFGCLSQLKCFELESVRLSALPASFGDLSSLERLLLSNVDVVELPESFGNLSSLTTLVIAGCHNLASLPESFGRLLSLEELRITDCPRLECPQDTKSRQVVSRKNLSSLKFLWLKSCTSLEAVPACFGLLWSLEELELDTCTELKTLPGNLGQFKALKTLRIYGADKLQVLPDDFGKLPSLTRLVLVCRRLKRLPKSFGLLSTLQYLHLNRCEALQVLPDNFGLLCALQTLEVCNCTQLRRLPDNFGQLEALQSLGILNADLEGLPHSFCRLSALQKHNLDRCVKLQRLPDNFGDLSSLETLRVVADDLEELPNNLGDLSALKELFVMGQRLQSLPRSIGKLQSLRRIQVAARSLRSLPDELGDLSSLEVLTIHNCAGIITFPDSSRRISSLRAQTIRPCTRSIAGRVELHWCSLRDMMAFDRFHEDIPDLGRYWEWLPIHLLYD